MKIAIGTDDLKTIRSGHFGESRYYKIFEINDGQIASTEIRENPEINNEHGGEHQHGKAKQIMQILSDCNVFIARSMGMHSIPKLVKKGVHPIITKEDDIEQTITKFLNGDIQSFRCFNPETKKFVPCTERPV